MQHPDARFQQLAGAAELVDHEAADVGLVVGLEQGQRAVQRREHPAPVDVAHHDHGQVRGPGQAHVGDVGGAQVDLGRAARSLADDHVVLAPQLRQAVQGHVQQAGGVLPVLDRVNLAHRAAEHDHLAAPVAARLEQHRVHPRVGLQARGRGLHGLRSPDLRAVGGDEGVQRHVLGLERGHAHAPPGQPAAQPGREHALARVRGRARHQKRASRHHLLPIAAIATADAAAAAVVVIVTRRQSRTARRMSAGRGGCPSPSSGRRWVAPA